MKIIRYKELKSTNIEASRIYSEGNEAVPFVLVSEYQLNGKGQGAKSWHSEAGSNLLLSWVFEPVELSVRKQFNLSKVVTLAINDLLLARGVRPKIKWPNDILVAHKKIAGVLIENRISGEVISSSIAGIGLNVNQKHFPEFPREAISMSNISGENYKLEELLEVLLNNLIVRLHQLEEDERQLSNDFIASLYAVNEKAYFQHGDEKISGIVRGVSTYGELLLEQEGSVNSFGHHQLQFCD